MRKEGFGNIFISKDAKVNAVLLLSIVMIFLLTIFYTQAMSIKLLSPGNVTLNNSVGRNVNFTFNVTWDRDRENQSNCTLFVNSTMFSGFSGNGGWVGVANRTNGTGISSTKDGIINNSISGINYTFTVDSNYTWNIGCNNGSTDAASITTFFNSTNFTFLLDSSAPSFNFTNPDQTVNSSLNTSSTGAINIQFNVNDTGYGLNMTANNSINLSIFLGGARVVFFNYTNQSDVTRLSCSATSVPITTATTTCNATYNFVSNGTYLLNISAMDALGTYSTGISTRVTIDQIPPYITNFTICGNTTFGGADACDNYGSMDPSTVQVTGGTGAQAKEFFAIGNFTDNLTQILHADLQFFNASSGSWQTINSTNLANNGANISNNGINTNATVNFTFTPSKGHNVFEGRNVTFRILVNDTLGNRNANASDFLGVARNITININDTTKPTVSINGTAVVNGSNLSSTTFLASWSLVEGNSLRSVNVSIDGIDQASENANGCSKFKSFAGVPDSGSPTDPNTKRNSSFSVSTSAGCGLSNSSTHNITVVAADIFNNTETVFNTFAIQSGGVPGLNFSNVTANNLVNTAAVNSTNLTSSITRDNVMGLGFYGLGVAGVSVANLSYVSSCASSTTVYFQNNTVVFPFNASTCPTTSGNRTLAVTVTDTAGNSNVTTFTFLVDNVAPSIYVYAPTNGQYFTNSNISINLSVIDQDSSTSFVGYYLDNASAPTAINTSTSGGTGGQGVNNTYGNSTWFNFIPGTHKIKLTANDSLGNVVNGSVLTFTITGPLNFSDYVNSSLLVANTNISFVNLTDASGETLNNRSNSIRIVNDSTLTLMMKLNGTQRIDNISIVFNGSAANWDRNFTFLLNASEPTRHINNNFTADVKELVWFDKSIQDFLTNNNSYYGIVRYKINASNASADAPIGGNFELWYFPDISDVTVKTNLTECAAGFNPSFTFTSSSACWNNTDNYSVNIYLPHFSGIAGVNNSGNPTVNVTTPTSANQSVATFVPNITVSADAVSCVYSINGTSNKTMTLSNLICLGLTENFKNGNQVDGGYNFTFTVTDLDSNINYYVWKFNVTDNTAPNVPNLTTVSSSVTSTTASVTISGINETVNATVYYATTVAGIAATTAAMETDFNTSQTVSLSGLSAATLYSFNITICDYAGNCAKNGTFNFTTSSASSSSSSSSSGGGGGGGSAGGTTTTTSALASAGRSWDALAAGAVGTFNINKDTITITGITFDVNNALTNPSMSVASLSSNPEATEASAKVYQYLQITKSNIGDSDISGIKITFKVPKSWLTSNGISEDDVVLYRYSDDKWNELVTTKTGSDSDDVMYQSTTPGFSVFAVGVKGATPVETPETPEAPSTPQVTPPSTPNVPQPPQKPAPHEMVKGGLSRTAIGWIVVVLIVVVATIGYFMWQRKKEY